MKLMIKSATSSSKKTKSKVGFWSGDLGYPQAVVAVFAAFALGVVLHFLVGYRLSWGQTPLIWFYASLLPIALVGGRLWRHRPWMHWLSSIPFAVTTTTAVGVIALLGGIIPSSSFQQMGVPNLWSSWPFLNLTLIMLINLVASVGKRVLPLTYSNIVYQLSHAGLATSIIAGAYSAANLDRYSLVLQEGRTSNIAVDAAGNEVRLPFSVKLNDFMLESYAPTILLAQKDSKAADGLKITPSPEFLKKGATLHVGGYDVKVLEFIPKALLLPDGWTRTMWETGAPVAKLEVTQKGKKIATGWMSCGSLDAPSEFLNLTEVKMLAMADPAPKKFMSHVEVIEGKNKHSEVIEVNKKLSIHGYDLYQLSYDEKMGAASQVSVLEVVQDRGIPFVYAGMIMVLIGACLHLWNGIGGSK